MGEKRMDLDFMEEIIAQFRRDNNMEREMVKEKEERSEVKEEWNEKGESESEPYSWLREYCPSQKVVCKK